MLSRTDSGLISFVRGNKDLGDILGQLVALPIYYLGDTLAGSKSEHGAAETGATPKSAAEPTPTPEASPSPENQ